VLATYGRALWTGDITPLQELSRPSRQDGLSVRHRAAARYGFGNQGMNYNLFGDKYWKCRMSRMRGW
jgi:hypothetical protein